MFSPEEQAVDLSGWKNDKEEAYYEHVNTEREEIFDVVEHSYEIDKVGDVLGVLPSLELRRFPDREREINKVKSDKYLDYFVDLFSQGVNNYVDETEESARS